MPDVIYGFTLVYLFFKGDTTNILHASPVTSSLTEESTDRPSAPMTSITDSNSIQLLCQKDAKSFLSLHDREWKVLLNKKASWAFSKSSCKYLRPTTIQNQQKGAIWVWVHTPNLIPLSKADPKLRTLSVNKHSPKTFSPPCEFRASVQRKVVQIFSSFFQTFFCQWDKLQTKNWSY